MVERNNRSLLQLLRSYVESQNDWECYLPLVLYAYRTATHSSTRAPPFVLMFGRSQVLSQLTQANTFDATSYPGHLTAKFAELQDLVESNLVAAAQNQKTAYDKHILRQSFAAGDPLWLSIPTARKLDPRWKGRWEIKSIKSAENVEIMNSQVSKVVHVNRVRHRIQLIITAEQPPNNRKDGKSSQSRVQKMWRSRTAKYLKLSTQTGYVTTSN